MANDTCNCAVGFTGTLCETASMYKYILQAITAVELPFTNIPLLINTHSACNSV